MTFKKVLLYLCGGIIALVTLEKGIVYLFQDFFKKTSEELIACSDEKSKTFIRVEFNAKDKLFVVNGSVMRTPEQTNKATPLAVSAATSGYKAAISHPFVGYDPRAGNVCKIISIPLMDPNTPDRKQCSEGMSQLEWIEKYRAGKAESQNAESDKKAMSYSEQINKYCRQYDGQLFGVWFSIPEQGKPCDRIGILINEYAFPLIGLIHPSQRLKGLFQEDLVKCTYNADAIARLESEGHLTLQSGDL